MESVEQVLPLENTQLVSLLEHAEPVVLSSDSSAADYMSNPEVGSSLHVDSK